MLGQDEQIVFYKDLIPYIDGISLGTGLKRWNIYADEIYANIIIIDRLDLVDLTVSNDVSLGTNTSGDPLVVIDNTVPNRVTIDGDLTVTGSFRSVTVIETNQMDDLTISDTLTISDATVSGVGSNIDISADTD